MKYFLFSIALICSVGLAYSAEPITKLCESENYKTLDFWLGDWKVEWQGGEGTNSITKSHGDCVVNEDFNAPTLHGMSISTYVKSSGQWRQVWMDNNGGFFDFYGQKDGDNYIFHTRSEPQKPDVQLRMIFTDIKADSLIWYWQKTTDGGQSWQEKWKINYTRIK